MKKILTTALLLLVFLSAIAFVWLKTSPEGKKLSAVSLFDIDGKSGK
jgi:hypothetical protein